MRFVPRTLFGQVLLALVVGFVVAHAIGAWVMLEERARFGERLLGGYSVQRIAGIVSLLQDAEPADREKLVRALSVPPTRVTLAEPWKEGQADPGDEAGAFAERLGREIGRETAAVLPVQVLSIVRASGIRSRGDGHRPAGPSGAEGDAPPAPPPGEWRPRAERGPGPEDASKWKGPGPGRGGRALLLVVAQVKLGDGAVATFRHALPQPTIERPLRALAWGAGTWLVVALLVGWTVRRLTRPLAALADAASRLPHNLDQAPVPETGPKEVARAARAFNTMQRDLRNFLHTRSQALAGVSHDLRLPLTRVRLRLEGIGDAALRQAIERDLGEMDAMIGSTLEFLRAGAGTEKPIRFNLDALVEGVADDAEALGAQVRVQGSAGTPVEGRPNDLRRCLANLVDNARVHGGGEIELTVRDAGAMVEIRIEDRGPGIPAAEREHVFEPYVRLDPSRAKHTGGTGLGLAIARAVARAHGGTIALEDRTGGGIAVVLLLPRSSPAAK
jgi:signal transduction histidine kinase